MILVLVWAWEVSVHCSNGSWTAGCLALFPNSLSYSKTREQNKLLLARTGWNKLWQFKDFPSEKKKKKFPLITKWKQSPYRYYPGTVGFFLEENMNTVMDMLHKTWSHEPTKLLLCRNQNSRLCFCIREKKKRENSFFFFFPSDASKLQI